MTDRGAEELTNEAQKQAQPGYCDYCNGRFTATHSHQPSLNRPGRRLLLEEPEPK